LTHGLKSTKKYGVHLQINTMVYMPHFRLYTMVQQSRVYGILFYHENVIYAKKVILTLKLRNLRLAGRNPAII